MRAAGVNLRLRIDHGTGMNQGSGCCRQRLLPELRHAGKVQIGLIGDDAGATRAGQCLKLRADNHARGLGHRQLTLVLGVAEKAELPGLGAFQRRQAINQQIRIAMQFAAQRFNNGT